MQSALSFAPLRPVGFVNFHGAGRGGARPAFCGAAYFSTGLGGATISDSICQQTICDTVWDRFNILLSTGGWQPKVLSKPTVLQQQHTGQEGKISCCGLLPCKSLDNQFQH